MKKLATSTLEHSATAVAHWVFYYVVRLASYSSSLDSVFDVNHDVADHVNPPMSSAHHM
jgi:hypothetical protein